MRYSRQRPTSAPARGGFHALPFFTLEFLGSVNWTMARAYFRPGLSHTGVPAAKPSANCCGSITLDEQDVVDAGASLSHGFSPAQLEQRMAAENWQLGAQRANAHPPNPASSFSLDGVLPQQFALGFAAGTPVCESPGRK